MKAIRVKVQLVVIVMSVLVAAGLPVDAAEKSATRVFKLEHADVTEAITAIRPLLSEHGSFTVKISESQLTVQDRPDIVTQIADRIRELDQPPTEFKIRIELLEASNDKNDPAGDAFVDPRVRRMFQYSSYRSIASNVIAGELGTTTRAELGSAYHVSFLARPASRQSEAVPADQSKAWSMPGSKSGSGRRGAIGSEQKQPPAETLRGAIPRIELRQLTLIRQDRDADGMSKRVQVLRTNMLLAPGQETLIGASASEQSQRAVILMVRAEAPGNS
jgi:type II secretory pathway component GspD/PulD (secretin)